MQKSLGAFCAALLIGWVILGTAACVYARARNIPAWLAVPIAAAFLVEYAFYVAPGFEFVKTRFEERLSPARLASFLCIAGVVPYLIYTLPTGQFRWAALLSLVLIVAGVSYWYTVFPGTVAADIGILLLLGAVVLTHLFRSIYTSPVRELPPDLLGHIMLIRSGIAVMLFLRRVRGTGFGFVPSAREFAIGLRYFGLFVPIGAPIAWWLGLLRSHRSHQPLWQTAGLVLGIFWVVALSEEFFFRGVLQQWLARWTRSRTAALIIASISFGLVHLPFRHFPNWRLAIVAAIAGCFYGLAFRRAGSIRASMVSHTLVAAAWRVFFW